MSLCKQPLCELESKRDGYCRSHYLEYKYEVWLDNTEPQNPKKGIIAFAKDLLPEATYNQTPKHHYEMAQALLELYDPDKRNVYERLTEFIVFRGGGKSSLANTIFGLYVIAFNGMMFNIRINGEFKKCKIEEKFIVILSETGESAEEYTETIRNKFSNDQTFQWHFPVQLKTVYDNETKSWSKSAFWINGIYVLARGWKQQIRGKLKGCSRPTFLIVDDIYSEENIKTEASRKAIRNKWNAGIFNSIDPVSGKAAILCTILHEDTIVVDNKYDDLWNVVEYPIMPIDKFTEFVEKHMVVNRDSKKVHLKYDDEPNNYIRESQQRKYYDTIQNNFDWKLAWPDRLDLFFIALKYKSHANNNTLSTFYQEFFHIIMPDENKKFRKEYFQPLGKWSIINKFGYTWLDCPKLYTKPMIIRLRVAIDKAGEDTMEQNDNTAILLGGSLEDGRRVILRKFNGKTSERDTLYDELPEVRRRDKIILDRSLLRSKGYIDEAIRMVIESGAKELAIGVGGAENQNIKEIQAILRANGMYGVRVIKRVQSNVEGAKWERIIENIGFLYQSYMVYHSDGLEELETQLEYLKRYKYDDLSDCAEVLFYELKNPYHLDLHTLERPQRKAIDVKYEALDWRTVN